MPKLVCLCLQHCTVKGSRPTSLCEGDRLFFSSTTGFLRGRWKEQDVREKHLPDWRELAEDPGHVIGGTDAGARKTLQGSRLMRSVADTTSALLLGGDLMITVFQVQVP